MLRLWVSSLGRAIRLHSRLGVLGILAVVALALPAAAHATTVAYTGQTSPQDSSDNGVNDGSPETFGFDFDGAAISYVQTYTSLRCPDGSFMNMGTVPNQPGEPFPVTNGHFDATIGDPNSGNGITWHFVGSIVNSQASGTADVQAHEYSSVSPTGPICTSSFTWSASAPRPSTGPSPMPAVPTPPRARLTPATTGHSPDAGLFIVGLRTADGRRYFWGTLNVRCIHGATHVIVTVGRSRRAIKCWSRLKVASSAVAPHRTYTIRVRVVRMLKHRVIAKGRAYKIKLFMPGNEANWVPVPGLHLP